MTVQATMQVISLALSIGGFAGLLLSRDKSRAVIAAIVVSAAIAMLSAGMLYNNYLHQIRVKEVENRIVKALGSETRTLDDIYGDMYYPEPSVLTEALDILVNQDKVGHRILELRDGTGRILRVRGYYTKK